MEASSSLPLHLCHLDQKLIIINRAHMLFHSIALCFLIYYRVSFFFSETQNYVLTSLWSLVFASELILAFLWVINQAFRWRPVTRTVFPERLPEDDKLPAIDVFVCTADPTKEPTVDVMNTVISAMALDYPPEKMHVYLSDDGGSPVTLFGMKEAYAFARWWLPFCRKFRIKTRCPKAYFGDTEQEEELGCEYASEKQKIRDKYELFEGRVNRFRDQNLGDPSINSRDHTPVIEVIRATAPDEEGQNGQVVMPLLVYVSREKRPSHPHHFKAGALNALLRVSAVMSNSPYILGLDCDMYINDPSSARQAMCFHLDPKLSRSLAFVQFPQMFGNISKNDIYDGKLRMAFWLYWYGLDGLQGPILSGTCYYLKREALYGKFAQNSTDLMHLKEVFGASGEFIKCLQQNKTTDQNQGRDWETSMVLREAEHLAACSYENSTRWGEQVGFMYFSLVEDYFTGFTLHCKGWSSVYLNPTRPQFLGTATTNLNDLLVQGTRWSAGLIQVGLSRFSPLIHSLSTNMSVLEAIGYAELALFPLYFIPVWCYGVVPQLCLLHGIPLYPEVSSPYFMVFVIIFFSSNLKELHEIMSAGHSAWLTWMNECRHWMIKSVTCHMYGSINAIMDKIGLREVSFLPTNKADQDEQTKLYEMGMFDFQAPVMFLVPMVGLVILNMFALVTGVARALVIGDWEDMLVQMFLSTFILAMGFPVIEGMLLRKDKGRVPPRVTVLSAICVLVCVLASSIMFYH